ncbi:MAG: Hpt domain-containing protein [Aureispira sp.]
MELTVDLTFLNEISDGDQEFITDVLQTFLEEMPKDMGQLRTAIEANNSEGIGKVAHKTKSTLQTLGLHELKEMAYTIEQNAKSPASSLELSKHANTFANYIDKACAKVRTLLD